MRIAIIAIPLLLMGCGESPEERSQRHDTMCKEWGAKPASNEYIQCRATLAKNAEIKDNADSDAAASIAMSSAAISMSSIRR